MRGKVNHPFFKSVLLHAIIILIVLIPILRKSEERPIGALIDVEGAPKRETENIPATSGVAKATSGEAGVASSRVPGAGITPSEMQKYFTEVMNRINRTKRYPEDARLSEQEGLVQLKLEIAPDGKILNVAMEKITEFKILNDAATAAIERLGQLPPLPPNSDGSAAVRSVVLHVPIQFKLN